MQKNYFANILSLFHICLAFFSILGRPQKIEPANIELSWFFIFPVALILGGISGLPFLCPGSIQLKALLSLGLSLILTRCLHWDGWADLWDGIGSGVKGEKFFAILKDSRIGTFGAIGLWMGLLAEWLLLVQANSFSAVCGMMVFSRCQLVITAWCLKKWSRPGLGRLFISSITPAKMGINLITCAMFISWTSSFLIYVLASLIHLGLSFYLQGLARKHQGANGDFLGAAIIAGEIIFLAAFLVH